VNRTYSLGVATGVPARAAPFPSDSARDGARAAAHAAAGPPLAGRIFLGLLERLRVGQLALTLPSGERRTYGHAAEAAGTVPRTGDGPPCSAELVLHDWRACARILRAGDIGFGEALYRGWIDSPDLPALLRLVLRNEDAVATTIWGGRVSRLANRLRHALRRNSRARSRQNIHAHYDIGNDFYGLWLDPSWTYSAALFRGDPTLTLESAQHAKYQRVVDKLGLARGMRVLEIGCGWGGFALYAAQRGIAVHGITISPAQLELAQQRVAAAGLQHLVTLELRDYRDLTGRYDAIVSIEMFEAVGQVYWRRWFAAVHRLLAPGGRALVQSITIAETRFAGYRASSDFIRHYIFPGGMLPTPGRFIAGAARVGLVTRDVLAFGRDYAETLRRWRTRFDAAAPAVLALGLDAAFVRLWRLYLAYCEAGFEEGRTDVVQVLLQRE